MASKGIVFSPAGRWGLVDGPAFRPRFNGGGRMRDRAPAPPSGPLLDDAGERDGDAPGLGQRRLGTVVDRPV